MEERETPTPTHNGFTITQLRCNNSSDCTTKEKKLSITQQKSLPLLPRIRDGALQPLVDSRREWHNLLGIHPRKEVKCGNRERKFLVPAADCCPKKGKECKWQQLLLHQSVTLHLDTFKLHLLDDKSFNHNQRFMFSKPHSSTLTFIFIQHVEK